MMDIIFYDLEINKLYVLPSHGKDNGYISMNCTIEFNGDGSFELLFWDSDLEKIVKSYPDGMIIKWGEFEGFCTDYQFTDTEKRLYGTHLNGVLHKEVIPLTPEQLSGDLETIAYAKINECYSWLTTAPAQTGFESIVFSRDTYKPGNEFISDMVAIGHAGYKLYIDYANKKIMFKLLKSEANPLMLSESNLNAYEFQEDYDGKTIAYGGWYQQEQPNDADGNTVDPIWTYIGDATKTGLYKQDVVLSAKTADEATTELAEYKANYQLSVKTKDIEYITDYKLGDKVRIQKNGTTMQKTITSINIWHESNQYHEEPILGDLEEATNDE